MATPKGTRRTRGGNHTCVYFRDEDWQTLDTVRQRMHEGTLKHKSLSDFIQEAVQALAKTYRIH